MTITLEEYRRRESAGLIRRPLTWAQGVTIRSAAVIDNYNNVVRPNGTGTADAIRSIVDRIA